MSLTPTIASISFLGFNFFSLKKYSPALIPVIGERPLMGDMRTGFFGISLKYHSMHLNGHRNNDAPVSLV
jgi:hypothetical protein